MPRYDFKNIPSNISIRPKQKLDASIILDGKNYQEESINTQFIKKIEYKNSSGTIIIQGLFDLSKSNIENLIILKNLSLSFSPELKSAYKQHFDTPKIFVKFNLISENEEMIKKHINKLKNILEGFDTDYKGFVKFNRDGFNDVNMIEMMNEFEEEEKNKFVFALEEIKNDKKNFLEINDNIDDDNLEEDEINKNNNNEIINFFPFKSMNDNEIEKEMEKEEEIEENNIKKNNYIKVKDIDTFKIEKQKINFGNKFLKKYVKKINKEGIVKGHLMPININNSLLSVETNNDKIEFKNVMINDNLKELNEQYKKDVILDFLNLLIGNVNFINPKNIMSLNDYTVIVLSLIKNIDKKLSEIKKNKENELYILRLEKINSSLKLFHILFLNCFYPLKDINNSNNNYFKEDENLFDDFSSLKVQTMRKKLLIEWCMSIEKNYISKTDLININKNKKKEILTKQIMSFGQIKTAIKTNQTRNLFLNSKLSYLSNTNQTLSYLIKNQKGENEINKTFISYKANEPNSDKIKNTWISFFLQSLLYKEKNNEYIIKSINLIDEKMKDMDENSKPMIQGKFQLNYILIKIYEKIIKGVKDINDIEQYLNEMSNNNLFGKNNSDHFIQFIFSYLFNKIIHILSPEFNDLNSFYKKNYFLLMQIISEILSAENNDENIINKLIIICKLLYVSNINNKIKQKIFVDIISKQNLISIDDFWEVYNRENISLLNEMNKEYINGIFYLNKNELFMAYKSLLKSKRYKNAIDIYLKYCFLLINQNKINDINFKEIYTNLKEMNEKAPLLFNDFYLDFSSFVSYKVFKDRIDYKEIMDLLQKFINKYSGKNKIIYLDDISYRFIISELCQLLKEKRDKNNNLIICGELKLNELEEITCEDKNNVLNDVFKDLIEHKNTQFYINEF